MSNFDFDIEVSGAGYEDVNGVYHRTDPPSQNPDLPEII